ncbi:MAG: hypothetical protein JXA54_02220 [Candidatus Heimdallarchaeota archaeon]|nr:hypothetical protein [Candidatus Heimdallarchaeota archaeon]
MKILVMIAREITQKEIKLGIGTELSGTRLSPIFKSLDLNIPIKNNQLYTPEIPIDPNEGTPMLLMPLLTIPNDKSILFGTPSIIDKINSLNVQPTNVVFDPGKGTGNPIIAASMEAKDDDILILSPCDQYQSPAVATAVTKILEKIDTGEFKSGTMLTKDTKNPAFSYIKVSGDRAVEFMLKGTIPKDDMIAETMVVCVRAGYLKQQITAMKKASIEQLKEIYPYKENELIVIQKQLQTISELIENKVSTDEYLKSCPFCDFSKAIHRLLIPNMTYATVKYLDEWDDLGDWQKIYRSPLYPKDQDGNVVFSQADLISYSDCSNSLIANFTYNKVILQGLKNRIVAIGKRGIIDLSLEMDPQDFKNEVVKLQM